MMRKIVVSAVLALVAGAATVSAEDVKVLSAGAVEPGLRAFAAMVKRDTGDELVIQFNTAPQIAKRLAAGEHYDILISPVQVIEQATKDGKLVAGTGTPVGKVGVGVVVRAGVTPPDISSPEALKRALLVADSVVYNSASTGIYLDKLFAQMGVLDQLKEKTTRYPDGASVMEHVSKGKGNEIGFGAITEIKQFESTGLRFVGPLSGAMQNYTSYAAGLMTDATAPDAAKRVLSDMAAPATKATFVSAGIE